MQDNSLRNVYCLGETVLDIIFTGNRSVAAKPGGSLLNTAVSLARTGIEVHLISEIFRDDPGMLITRFLDENQVGCSHLVTYDSGNTPVALAFLNDDADAKYTFYKSYPADRLNQKLPVPGPDDILLFGSIYSLTAEIRDQLVQFVARAKENETLVIYDPNFRKTHHKDMPGLLSMIRENLSLADIIRGSDEDFLSIFASDNPEQVFDEVQRAGCGNLVLTRSEEDVVVCSGDRTFSVAVPDIVPVSTIGAGDAFNAGIIYGLIRENIYRKDLHSLSLEQWTGLAVTGIRFSQNVCRSLDNYVEKDFARLIT
jgi:fructokinase